jgi:excisionase family DNA binding protein
MTTTNLMTATEAAKELRVTKLTFVRWLKDGKVPAFKVGFGIRAEWRIERDVVMAMKKHNQVKAA